MVCILSEFSGKHSWVPLGPSDRKSVGWNGLRNRFTDTWPFLLSCVDFHQNSCILRQTSLENCKYKIPAFFCASVMKRSNAYRFSFMSAVIMSAVFWNLSRQNCPGSNRQSRCWFASAGSTGRRMCSPVENPKNMTLD